MGEYVITFQPIGALTRAIILHLARKRVGARYTGEQSAFDDTQTGVHVIPSITGDLIEPSHATARKIAASGKECADAAKTG